MGVPVLVMGESGSGKSFAIKGLPPDETGIFSVEKGRLPFKGNYKVCKRATYREINSIFKESIHNRITHLRYYTRLLSNKVIKRNISKNIIYRNKISIIIFTKLYIVYYDFFIKLHYTLARYRCKQNGAPHSNSCIYARCFKPPYKISRC